MGICFSDSLQPQEYRPPVQQTTVIRYTNCKQCGGWVKQQNLEYCEICLQKNAMNVITPSAPPLQPQYRQQIEYQQQYPQYTYAVQYPQQQTYYQQQPVSYVSPPYNQYPPQQYPPQQRQVSTGTAVAGGFLAGMLAESILDPTE